MSEFISGLAQIAGLDESTAERGLGALLSAVRINASHESFANLSQGIPDAGRILVTFQQVSRPSSDGASLLDLARGLLGKDAGALGLLISQFSQAGFSLENAKAFIPVALDYLRNNISPDAMTKIDNALPGVSALLAGENTLSRIPIDSLRKLT
jgi:hypothetical protein